jgi:hypothetical protein
MIECLLDHEQSTPQICSSHSLTGLREICYTVLLEAILPFDAETFTLAHEIISKTWK